MDKLIHICSQFLCHCRYMGQLSDMQLAQDRQAKMLEGLLKQRDLYKNMYQECISQVSTFSNSEERELIEMKKKSGKMHELELENPDEIQKIKNKTKKWLTKFQDSESSLHRLSNNFEIYRKEKAAHEQMLNNEIERLRKDAEKNSVRCCRLKAQLDSANERFSLLQGNAVTYKSQIKVLEEKCNNYSIIIGKFKFLYFVSNFSNICY